MSKKPKTGDAIYLGNGIVAKLGPDIDLDHEIFLTKSGERITAKVAEEIVQNMRDRNRKYQSEVRSEEKNKV